MRLSIVSDGELEELAELVNTSYRGEGGWTNEIGHVQGERTTPKALRDDLAAEPRAHLLVWREAPSGPIEGCVWLAPCDRGQWYLGMLTVHPRRQDRGLGRTLLAAAEAYAESRGATGIRMTVVNVRDTLIAWYQRRGYRLTGETQSFPYEDAKFGTPKRDDLYFVVLEKPLEIAASCAGEAT
jgi:ribosomal protein S18 acetylase RimI-like enzyme